MQRAIYFEFRPLLPVFESYPNGLAKLQVSQVLILERPYAKGAESISIYFVSVSPIIVANFL